MFKAMVGLLLLSLISTQAYADEVNPKQFLWDQVVWGEIYYRDDFVQNALYLLRLIAPEDPDILLAQIRLALRQKNRVLAQKLISELQQKAPDSSEYRQAQMSVYLTTSEAQQKLQQARILSMSGQLPRAQAQYDALFHGDIPTPELKA
ncbi:MAG: hypothetical protein ACRCXC_05045 [Legionella sp.]